MSKKKLEAAGNEELFKQVLVAAKNFKVEKENKKLDKADFTSGIKVKVNNNIDKIIQDGFAKSLEDKIKFNKLIFDYLEEYMHKHLEKNIQSSGKYKTLLKEETFTWREQNKNEILSKIYENYPHLKNNEYEDIRNKLENSFSNKMTLFISNNNKRVKELIEKENKNPSKHKDISPFILDDFQIKGEIESLMVSYNSPGVRATNIKIIANYNTNGNDRSGEIERLKNRLSDNLIQSLRELEVNVENDKSKKIIEIMGDIIIQNHKYILALPEKEQKEIVTDKIANSLKTVFEKVPSDAVFIEAIGIKLLNELSKKEPSLILLNTEKELLQSTLTQMKEVYFNIKFDTKMENSDVKGKQLSEVIYETIKTKEANIKSIEEASNKRPQRKLKDSQAIHK